MLIFKQIIHFFLVYKKYIGRRLYLVFLLSALAAATEGFGIAMLLPLIDAIGVGIDDATIDQSDIKVALQNVLDFLGIGSSMVGILLFIAAIFLLKGMIVFTAGAYQSHLKAQLMSELKSMMFDRYCNMTYRYYIRRNTGHFLNMINGQIPNLIASFDNYKHFLATVITTVAYLLTAFLLAWNFALMALCVGIILLFFFRSLNRYVHGLSRKKAAEQGILNKYLVQTVQGFKYLASTAQMEHLKGGMFRSIQRLASYTRKQGIAQSLTASVSEPISIFFVLLVIIIQIMAFDAPLAPIFVALILFNRAMGGIIGLQSAWQGTLNKVGSLEMVEREFKDLETHQEYEGTTRLGPLKDHVELRHVGFAYEDQHHSVFKDLTLRIEANSTVAFVGESGAGKSTLVDMLTLILRPLEGEVLIDGIPGSDIHLESWRRQIGYVSQETVIFDDTIANNISLWNADYNSDPDARQRIENAARLAYAEGFILDLPQGYNTLVGDRGIRLSGGQKQRLFLARELYKNPRLLILDEATSALDSDSERFIQQSINALRGRVTVVIIAHRLSTIKDVDCVFVLEKGRVCEQGSYEELMSKDEGRFCQLAALQSL